MALTGAKRQRGYRARVKARLERLQDVCPELVEAHHKAQCAVQAAEYRRKRDRRKSKDGSVPSVRDLDVRLALAAREAVRKEIDRAEARSMSKGSHRSTSTEVHGGC